MYQRVKEVHKVFKSLCSVNWDIATRGQCPFRLLPLDRNATLLQKTQATTLSPSPLPPFPPSPLPPSPLPPNIVKFSHMIAQGNKPRGYFIPCPYVFRSSLAKGKRKVCWLSNTTQCTRLTLEPGFLDQASIELACVADRALVCLQRKLPSN